MTTGVEIEVLEEEDDPNYDSPEGSEWLVVVNDRGSISILSYPNIHYSFFDMGDTLEDLGLPTESEEEPGIYQWICTLSYSRDWESGIVDDWVFEVISDTLIIPLNKIKERREESK